MLEVATRSAPGRGHPYQDRVLVDERRGLFAVADGVTRSSQGDGAAGAELAVKLLSENFSGDLKRAVEEVHEMVFGKMRQEWSIGETTLTAMSVNDSQAEVCNVGDSPARLIQGANITDLYTVDKSMQGDLTQVIGFPESIKVHSTRFQINNGDVIILATDGVDEVLHPPLIYRFLRKVNAKEIADAIIQGARAQVRRGGYDDDKTVIVIRAQKT
ncbi:MAG TPA: SpoIIE family protein phosphatase [Nitrososphaerales archaeon]|nr:SpoIIE family protein phosphatase [Nitrososphaerales archaeon]